MINQDDASENLRIIRGLMERATVYRAISGPAALAGGGLALLVALACIFGAGDPSAIFFVLIWLLVLGATTAVNFYLLAKEAKEQNEPFLSRRMRTALIAIAPALGVGGVLGIANVLINGDTAACATYWALFYGLALLATSSFAPRSLTILGAAFTAAGLLIFCISIFLGNTVDAGTSAGSIIMALTFGVLHIAYGIGVQVRSKESPPEA